MKIKDKIGEWLGAFFAVFAFFLVIPFFFLFLIYKVLTTPFDYIRYKSSRYQRDFPHRYTWLCGHHFDNEAYTAIKKNGLPVEYTPSDDDYNLPGLFVYGDNLLKFHNPVFFHKGRMEWLWWNRNDDEDTDSEECGECEENFDSESTDDCLSVDDLKTYVLDEYNGKAVKRKCHRVVFFCERQKVERQYGKQALAIMRELDGFIVYEKGRLAEKLMEFLSQA